MYALLRPNGVMLESPFDIVLQIIMKLYMDSPAVFAVDMVYIVTFEHRFCCLSTAAGESENVHRVNFMLEI